MPPLVSIIIPAYNAAKHIRDTIDSALSQVHQPIEILVVDDGSTDNTLEVINRYFPDRVTVFRQENKGAAAARNMGVANSNGKYVQFLDADDLLPPTKISDQVKRIEDEDEDALVGCLWQRFTGSSENRMGTILPFANNTVEEYNKEEWLISRPMMLVHCWLVSRSLLTKTGLWNEYLTLNDDGEYFYRVVSHCTKIIITGNIVLYRSGNTESLSRRQDRNAMTSWVNSARVYKQIIQSIATPEAYESSDRLFFLIHFWCLNKFEDLSTACKRELHNDKRYELNIRLVDELAPIMGLRIAKLIFQLDFWARNNRALRKLLGYGLRQG